ncbi:PREDICTED: uncharacterized protein LOC106305472 [Brassica oleracea var. oleracea]|uniref:uncharacterized protein LOC106305472 n=1 Tax=Brassica oleracea var. oleracea TaxID=109376 RepID=UPI0006A6D6A9|nr:PREDICTED: uncharacterized protein LOC106305472 [Brassica oleracea var. oleracea]
MVDLTVKTVDLLWAVFFWAVLRYAPTVAVEMLFVILVIIVTMLGLDILRMCFTGVLAGNDLNPLETLAQVEEEQNYETSEKILRDVAEIRSKISQIELDVRQIKQIIYILQGKIESLESKQDATLSELCRLSQILSDEGNTSTKVL